MSTVKFYKISEADGWVKIGDGTATLVVQVKSGGVYMTLSSTQPDPFTPDHHTLPEWTTLTHEVGTSWIRTYSSEAIIIVSTIPITT